MARLRLGAVALAALLIVAAGTSIAAGASRGPRFSDTIVLDVDADAFRIVSADLNGDGSADLVTVNWNSSTISVLFSRGDGNFAKRIDYRAPRHPAGIAVADANADGRADLITASHSPAGWVAVWLNGGGGRFVRAGTYASGANAWAVASGDVNGDGLLDLVTAHRGRQQLAVLLGIGGGRFALAQRFPGPGADGIALGDLNRDGKTDAVLATAGARPIAVRLGQGDGSFGDVRRFKSGAGSRPGIALADFNRDGVLDVAASNEGAEVLLGNGDGTLRAGWQADGEFGEDAATAADLDGDGDLDMLRSGYPPSLSLGRGDGTFSDGPEFAFGGMSTGGTAADFNGDGRVDLASIGLCDYDCDFGFAVVWLNWTGLPAKPCIVPDVTEYFPISETLRESGCRVGHVTHRYSRTVRRGWAISQRPKPDTVLAPHGRVDVVVSRGRRSGSALARAARGRSSPGG
jgi:hypothetical protein